ncbi:MAG: tetratricopeptide repeat protein [Chitinophagaceae bacterium]|nr:tetratricopeptide repeat protein [Chitinophagaceae bacterium]
MSIANKQIHLKYLLIVFGMLFSSILYGQTKTDDVLYATWKDSSKPEIVRLEAIWERMDIDSLPNQEPDWWQKWKNEPKEAIELALKQNKRGYLPLFYMMTIEACAGNTECMCAAAKKVIESAKVANDSKLPFIFWAYGILKFQCNEDVKEEVIINEFNKMKSSLSDKPSDLKILRDANLEFGTWYKLNEKYPQALVYFLETQRLSEELKLIDYTYGRSNEELAGIHAQIGNYKEAEKYIDKSLQVAHSRKDTFSLGSSYLGKSQLMIKLKDEAKAQRYIDSAMYVMKNVKHCEPCYNIAKTLNAGIKNLSKNYSGALAELNEVQAFYNGEGKGQKPEPIFLYRKSKRAYLGLKNITMLFKQLTQ